MRQIAERLVWRGHDVTVATSRLRQRSSASHNGVKIEEFDVSGNFVNGMQGEVRRYQSFVTNFQADAVLIKAAQQWTFDALWDVIDDIKARKVFIPCGFPALMQPAFDRYYSIMPGILHKFDWLIFYSNNFRDINFARRHGLSRMSVVPNGADEREFSFLGRDIALNNKLNIRPESFVMLSVGSLTGTKGHDEVLEAFALLDTEGRHVTLVLNGNIPYGLGDLGATRGGLGNMYRQAIRLGCSVRRLARPGALQALSRKLKHIRRGGRSQNLIQRMQNWKNIIDGNNNKSVVFCDLPREDLVKLYKNSDLFIFASNVEYSPLVLFESAASGTPFLTVPVGNAEEIARWTGGGLICPAVVDGMGFVRTQPHELAKCMAQAIRDPSRLADMGMTAHNNWKAGYTWDLIVAQYESILAGTERGLAV
ncbi:Glycosyltransferase involved in cell wall bisynthesis [Chelatococcus sambhunathii]|uniref:Glycosyltransferase involved in cell wall bisynthesis n=1 Tax=Chelatococcus sambhunathii TaxID=363953 RepID=A0ABM9U2J3_9HYPH|nr:Glycosyltransferase involved in cell wall bisynthesis [Chelatococcus sambhunathii]